MWRAAEVAELHKPSKEQFRAVGGWRSGSKSEMHQQNKVNKKMEHRSWVPVAHTCNPSYSGSRDQEDCGLKPAWANSSQDPILKKLHKKGLVERFKVYMP
jgi:hypothetical protein